MTQEHEIPAFNPNDINIHDGTYNLDNIVEMPKHIGKDTAKLVRYYHFLGDLLSNTNDGAIDHLELTKEIVEVQQELRRRGAINF
jgi:hypothetical protein